jgi:hypothetical protein
VIAKQIVFSHSGTFSTFEFSIESPYLPDILKSETKKQRLRITARKISRRFIMKKWMLLAGLVVLVAIVAVPVALAQGPTGGFGLGNSSMGYGPGFVDQNGDGVCDNFVDENGDGVCDNAGAGTSTGRHGPGFVDQNGDGVCDNFIDENGDGVCDNAGTGTGGRGAGFVDQDGDGVCDHAGVGGHGQGRRGGMARGAMGRGAW